MRSRFGGRSVLGAVLPGGLLGGLLGGCHLAHVADGRDGGTERDGAPEVCALEPHGGFFEVHALTRSVPSEPRDWDALGRVYLDAGGDSYRWDPATGRLRSLDSETGVSPRRIARVARAASGGTIVGELWDGTRLFAFAWSAETGAVDLSLDDLLGSSAQAIGVDGMVLVNESGRASLRTMSRHVLPLGLPPDADARNAVVEGMDVARDGTVVGRSSADGTLDVWRAFVWRSGEGITLLPNDGARHSQALAVSGDGRLVVGNASSLGDDDVRTPVVWRDGVMERIAVLDAPGLTSGAAVDVTDDGVIVGTDSGPMSPGVPASGWLMVGARKLALDVLIAEEGAWRVLHAVRVADDLRVLAVARRAGSDVREAVLLEPRCTP